MPIPDPTSSSLHARNLVLFTIHSNANLHCFFLLFFLICVCYNYFQHFGEIFFIKLTLSTSKVSTVNLIQPLIHNEKPSSSVRRYSVIEIYRTKSRVADPHYFWKLDPDLHLNESWSGSAFKLKFRQLVQAQKQSHWAPSLIPITLIRSRIRIRIEVKICIRIRNPDQNTILLQLLTLDLLYGSALFFQETNPIVAVQLSPDSLKTLYTLYVTVYMVLHKIVCPRF